MRGVARRCVLRSRINLNFLNRDSRGGGGDAPGGLPRGPADGTPGVLYRCEKKEFAWKGICNFVKRRDIFIDAGEGGICKVMKTKERSKPLQKGAIQTTAK